MNYKDSELENIMIEIGTDEKKAIQLSEIFLQDASEQTGITIEKLNENFLKAQPDLKYKPQLELACIKIMFSYFLIKIHPKLNPATTKGE